MIASLPENDNVVDRAKEYENWCNFLVFAAVAIPCLAEDPRSTFDPDHENNENNAICIAKAVNNITTTLFSAFHAKSNHNDTAKEIRERLLDFIKLGKIYDR